MRGGGREGAMGQNLSNLAIGSSDGARLSAVIVSFHSFVSSKVTGVVRWCASAR